MYVIMYVCMYVCMYVRTYVRMYVCMYVCMYTTSNYSRAECARNDEPWQVKHKLHQLVGQQHAEVPVFVLVTTT